jgi:hypothetical protein
LRASSLALVLVGVVVLVAACRAPPPMLPVVATPPAQLPPSSDIVRTCAFEVSCLHNPPASTVSGCFYYFEAGLDWAVGRGFFGPLLPSSEWARYVACADAAADCESVLQCASRGHDPDFCAAHPGDVCDGDVLVRCMSADWPIYTTDCAALGMRCAEANGSASCTDGVGCAPGTAYCEGNRYFVSCDPTTHLRSREDCARSPIPHATCRIDASFGGRAGCLPSGPPCTRDRCEGDELVVCLAGEEVRTDCAQRASHCSEPQFGTPRCETDSDCGKTTDACAGSDLTSCVDGITHTIGCDDIGLATCAPAPGGSAPICVR